MSRSPKKKTKLTVLVQTHVSPEVGRMVRERAQASGDKDAAYLRKLIYRDLGLLSSNKEPSE